MIFLMRVAAGWLLLLTASMLAACGGDAPAATQIVDVPPTFPLSFDVEPESVTVAPGDRTRFRAISEEGGELDPSSLAWSSTDPAVARMVDTAEALAVDTGRAEVVADWSDVQKSATVQVKPHPHEPEGFTEVTDRPFNRLDEDDWWIADSTNVRILHIEGAVKDSTGVLEKRYPAHAGQGSAFGGLFGKDFAGRDAAQLYVQFWWKMSDDFYGHSSGVNKLFYIAADRQSNNFRDKVIINNYTSRSGPAEIEIRVQSVVEGARNLRPNSGDGSLTRGHWHHVEVLLKVNTPGLRDGQAKLWLDGREVISYDDIGYVRTGESARFIEIKFDPIWGGNNPADDVPHDMSYFIDHLYSSASP